MRPRDLLGTAIRAFGVGLIFQAASNGLPVLIKIKSAMTPQAVSPSENGAFAAFYPVTGIFLTVLADFLVQIVHGATLEPAIER